MSTEFIVPFGAATVDDAALELSTQYSKFAVTALDGMGTSILLATQLIPEDLIDAALYIIHTALVSDGDPDVAKQRIIKAVLEMEV
jgi:hypothetical protein